MQHPSRATYYLTKASFLINRINFSGPVSRLSWTNPYLVHTRVTAYVLCISARLFGNLPRVEAVCRSLGRLRKSQIFLRQIALRARELCV